jgi:hypothetical protein
VTRMPANAPLAAARQDPPSGVSPDAAASAVEEFTRLNRRHVPGVPARSLTLGGGVGLVVRHRRV